MGKVYRQDKKSVQRVKARDIVPGDIVEVAGKWKETLRNDKISPLVAVNEVEVCAVELCIRGGNETVASLFSRPWKKHLHLCSPLWLLSQWKIFGVSSCQSSTLIMLCSMNSITFDLTFHFKTFQSH